MHRPVLAYLVLEEAAVRLLDILRQVGVEHERGYLSVGQLRAVFYLYVLALYRWRRISLDERQHHLVELCRAHLRLAVEIDVLSHLKHLEYALLAFLVTHPGRTYSRDALLRRVWGFDYFGGSRTVDVHVRRVRAKLGPELSQHLETVRGVGYLWN